MQKSAKMCAKNVQKCVQNCVQKCAKMCAQNVQNIKFASFPLIFSAVEVGTEKEAKFCFSLFTE